MQITGWFHHPLGILFLGDLNYLNESQVFELCNCAGKKINYVSVWERAREKAG